MTLVVGLLRLVAFTILIWFGVGRDVLRAGYVSTTKGPSLETEGKTSATTSPVRHDGVLHLVIVDPVDPGLVLVVVRLDAGDQWISTVRTDQQGFGIARLNSWRVRAQRVVVIEKPRSQEVTIRPQVVGSARLATRGSRSVPTTWDRPLGQLGISSAETPT